LQRRQIQCKHCTARLNKFVHPYSCFPHLICLHWATVGSNTAVVESFNTNVTNGQLSIELDTLVQNPKINAIGILPLANSPMMTLKFTYPTARQSPAI